jgi:GR25 family glycosyltransferase involved in LPS biosynthesis
MEDDISLTTGFNSKITKMINKLPKDWDLFSGFIPKTGARKFRANPGRYLLNSEKEITKLFQTWSMLCYAITKPGAQKILDLLKDGINVPIDTILYTEDIGLNSYSISYRAEPICSIYASLDSTIQKSDFIDISSYLN